MAAGVGWDEGMNGSMDDWLGRPMMITMILEEWVLDPGTHHCITGCGMRAAGSKSGGDQDGKTAL